MKQERITLSVDSETARAYEAASDEERRKLDLLISLRLQEALGADEPLPDVMRQISDRVEQRGLTPDRLDEILDES